MDINFFFTLKNIDTKYILLNILEMKKILFNVFLIFAFLVCKSQTEDTLKAISNFSVVKVTPIQKNVIRKYQKENAINTFMSSEEMKILVKEKDDAIKNSNTVGNIKTNKISLNQSTIDIQNKEVSFIGSTDSIIPIKKKESYVNKKEVVLSVIDQNNSPQTINTVESLKATPQKNVSKIIYLNEKVLINEPNDTIVSFENVEITEDEKTISTLDNTDSLKIIKICNITKVTPIHKSNLNINYNISESLPAQKNKLTIEKGKMLEKENIYLKK